jgi:hypothetical protein
MHDFSCDILNLFLVIKVYVTFLRELDARAFLRFRTRERTAKNSAVVRNNESEGKIRANSSFSTLCRTRLSS